MRRLAQVLLPLAVLAGASFVAFVTVANRPEPVRRAPPVALTEVEYVVVEPETYTVRLASRGTVRARTESTLIPEVAGRVVAVSPRLRGGEFFEPGDVLLEIDPRDYRAEVTVAEAALAQARTLLAEERARAEQAERDWRRLGETAPPGSLVLRQPQLAAARAGVLSAEARLAQARLNLERTTIRAPYAGRVLAQGVDIGQYVSPGTVLATIYAVDYAEVRLPLTDRQLEFVTVSEVYRGDTSTEHAPGPPVALRARVGRTAHTWTGRIVRAEGAIDRESRQLFVVAQVDDPYGKGPAGRPPLKVGQFVEAEIEGVQLAGVIVIPRATLRAGGEVLVVGADGRLERREVEVVWSDAERAVVGGGLAPGDRLVVTPLGSGMQGVSVRAQPAGKQGVGSLGPKQGVGPLDACCSKGSDPLLSS